MNGKTLNNNGQILLLLVLVLGTLLIVAMTAMFQSTTSTQMSGVEQQSQITLAAAEAAIEKALQSGQSGTFASLGLTNLAGISLENSQVTINEVREHIFVTTKLEKDDQYTFYMAEYLGTYPNFFGSTYVGVPFYIYYQSDVTDCSDIALEMTVIFDQEGDALTGGSYEMKKYIIDPANRITSDNSNDIGHVGSASFPGASTPSSPPGWPGQEFEGQTFQCRTGLFDAEEQESEGLFNVKVIMVQSLFKGTTLAFAVENFEDALDNDPETNPTVQFPPQGRTVTATARASFTIPTGVIIGTSPSPTPIPVNSQTGLSRTAEVFQSYPQIPAEFWVTSF